MHSRVTKGKLERRVEGLEGYGPELVFADPLCCCCTTLINWMFITVQALGSGHADSGESENSPTSGVMNAKWRAGMSTRISINPNQKHALKNMS